MSKLKKLEYLHGEMMIASEQLEVLIDKIYHSDKQRDIMVLSGLSDKIAKKISKLNCSIGKLFKL